MDFFSAVADPSQPIVHNDRALDDAPDSFAEAIASRFGSGALLTTRLTPVTLAPPPLRLPSSPMASMSIAAPSPRTAISSTATSQLPLPTYPGQFTVVATPAIHHWIDDPTALILDIRPHAAHSTARVPRAVSLSVPSTLLKRPLFSLHRLADMLPSANARARFSTWRSASRILVYDADSSAIPESSNIYGLLRKFKNDGFQGDLAWLKGGFQAVWREKRDIIDTHPPTADAENDDDDDDDTIKSPQTQTPCNVLRTRHLPMSAFSFSSTTVSSPPASNSITNPKREPLARGATFPTLPTPSQNRSQPPFNPFFDAVRQNLELSQGITERIPLRLPRRVRHRIHDLPFSWLREIARRAAKLAPSNSSLIDSSSSASEGSEDDETVTSADVEEGKEMLAMQFFKVEVAEQRRLMGIMEHHSKETTIVTTQTTAVPASDFPYSITAGVEKGAKNRYRHIWPFEHARVKLHRHQAGDDDYVNASYVRPLGTNRRYIATQGPLPTTYTDFWTLCWEQDVHVIVMLTREVENSMVKCGSYWTDTVYGPLRLRLLSTLGVAPVPEELGEPSLFGSHQLPQRLSTSPAWTYQHRPSRHLPRRRSRENQIIRRVFELTHMNHPKVKPRRIIHLQYLEWPDMNVPDDPRGLLELVKEVENAVNETGSSDGFSSDVHASNLDVDATSKNRPVLLHCSAGVGRTGGFIAVDAILDAIRREVRSSWKKQQEVERNEDAMDIDVSIIPTPAPATASFSAANKDAPMVNGQGQLAERASGIITAGNGRTGMDQEPGLIIRVPVVPPTPSSISKIRASSQASSDGTEPEASESDREIPREKPSAATLFTAQTRQWAEKAPRTDDSAISVAPSDHQQRTASDSAPITSSSLQDTKSPPAYETSSSSGLSLLSGRISDSFNFPQSSSLATSISEGVISPVPSFSKDAHRSLSSPNNVILPASALPPADHVPSRPLSEPTDFSKAAVSGGQPRSNLSLRPNLLPGGPTPWLGECIRRRSPSPMARTVPDANPDGSAMPKHQTMNLPTAPNAPSYTRTVSNSSDSESPSGSLSPSADEGSVASQVSSYHLYLKSHHCLPLHAKSLPISLSKPDKKNVRKASVGVPVVERPSSPILSRSPAQTASTSAGAANYKEPRPLYDTSTPPSLTCFEDPIYEVIQDMREQRMSLCQSLRQYVFVHAAVIEGALVIVDEEKELLREEERERAKDSLDAGTERQEKDKSTKLEGTDAGGGNANIGRPHLDLSAGMTPELGIGYEFHASGGSRPRPFGLTDLLSASTSPSVHQSSQKDGSRNPEIENEGYFSGSLHTSNGHNGEKDTMDTDSSSMLQVPPGHFLPFGALPLQQPPRPSQFDAWFGKRSTSPADYLRDGSAALFLDDSSSPLKRPSVKRKQSGGSGEEGTRNKRAQNENSSRERARERQRERRASSSSHTRDTGLEGLGPVW